MRYAGFFSRSSKTTWLVTINLYRLVEYVLIVKVLFLHVSEY